MIRHLLEWLHRFLAPSYVEVGPPGTIRHAPHVPRVCPEHPPSEYPLLEYPPSEHPLPGSQARVRFDPERPFITAGDGLYVQRAAIDVLLADGRMSRLGILAGYDPVSHEPRRISYVPIHDMAPATEVSS